MAGLSCDLWEVINWLSDAAACEINFRQKRKQDPRETLDQVIFFLPINSFIAVATKQSFIQSLKFNLENKMEITFLAFHLIQGRSLMAFFFPEDYIILWPLTFRSAAF